MAWICWCGIAVGNRGYRLQAGVVILALGKFAAQHILPSQAGWNLEIFKGFRYSSYVVAALCGHLSLESPGYENWVVGEENFSDFIMSPRTPRAGEARVITVFAPQPHAQSREALLRVQPEDKAKELLTAVESHFPGNGKGSGRNPPLSVRTCPNRALSRISHRPEGKYCPSAGAYHPG